MSESNLVHIFWNKNPRMHDAHNVKYLHWFIFSFEAIFKADFSSTLLRKLASFLTPFDGIWCNHLLHSRLRLWATSDQFKEKNRNDLQKRRAFLSAYSIFLRGIPNAAFGARILFLGGAQNLWGLYALNAGFHAHLIVCVYIQFSFVQFQS